MCLYFYCPFLGKLANESGISHTVGNPQSIIRSLCLWVPHCLGYQHTITVHLLNVCLKSVS